MIYTLYTYLYLKGKEKKKFTEIPDHQVFEATIRLSNQD